MDFDLIISNVSRHIDLNKQDADLFISLLEPRHIPKKTMLVGTGAVCRYDHFVHKGCLKVCYINNKGNECVIKFAVEDWWVVDLDSFLNQKPSFYYIQAVEDTTFFQLSKRNYDRLYNEIPSFQKFSSERWQNGFIALQHRLIQNLSLTAEERYRDFLIKYPNLEQRISQKLISAYLGITPEFFSILRKKWATENS